MTRVAIFVFDGADELDVIGPFEVLRNAERFGAPIHAELVSIGRETSVLGSHGLQFHAHRMYDGTADVLIVPGGGYVDGAKRGVRYEIARGDLPRILAQAYRDGKVVGSVCTGAMLIAASNVALGRHMTTHAQARDDLRATHAIVSGERVVDDGQIVSAGGVTSGIDLALHLVRRFAGGDVAMRIAAELEYPAT